MLLTSRRWVLAGAIAVPATAAVPVPRDPFLGVWKLIAYRRTSGDGRVDHPYSEQPVGRITYDAAGRMSAQLMRPGRKSTLPVGVSFANGTANDAELREATAGFIAYFGTFDVDPAATEVVHHVQACLVPSWVGQDLRRKYRFSGNRMMLSAVAGKFSVDLTWERERT